MALSSISSSMTYGTAAGTRSSNTLQTASRGNINNNTRDTFVCSTCGQQRVSAFYCPTCSGGSAARASNPNLTTADYAQGTCTTCNKGWQAARSVANRAGSAYYHAPTVNGAR